MIIQQEQTKKQRFTKLINELKKLIVEEDEQQKELAADSDINIIIKSVSVAYSILPNIIIATNKRGKFYEAKQMCFCLLSECLGLSAPEIAKIFNRNKEQIYCEFSKFEKLDPKNKIDAHFLNKFNTLKQDFYNSK